MLFELRELAERKGTLAVSDVYDLVATQSASTSYRQLMALKQNGLVTVTASRDDKRLRTVSFTSEAEELFRLLGSNG